MNDEILEYLTHPLVGQLVMVVIGLALIAVAVRLLKRWLTGRIEDKRTRFSLKQAINFVGYVIAVLLVISAFSGELPALSVALGVAGAGIAFALQEVIASLAGWIAISFGQFYTMGDRVQLGGIRGDVIHIGALRTSLMEIAEWVKADQYSGRIVRISNAFVFKEPVFNYSEEIPFIWDEITLPVRYGSDHRLAREILLEAAEAVVGDTVDGFNQAWHDMQSRYPVEPASVKPAVFLIADDNWMHCTLRYPVNAKRRRVVHDELFMYILDALAEAEGRVELASATFEVVGLPGLDVHVRSGDETG